MANLPKGIAEPYPLTARIYAIAADILEDAVAHIADGPASEEWAKRGVTRDDAGAVSVVCGDLLRIHAIEFGLKHIIRDEMTRPMSGNLRHNVVEAWDCLDSEWQEKISEGTGIPMGVIRDTLDRRKNDARILRYGYEEQDLKDLLPPHSVLDPAMIEHDGQIIRVLAGYLGASAHGPIDLGRERGESR